MRRSVAGIMVPVAVLVIGVAVHARAFAPGTRVQQPASADVLPALLTEVRGLRAAMERMAAAGPRVQLALGRVQLQEQRINNLIRRLDEVRASAIEAQTNHDQMQEALRVTESALRSPAPDGPPIEQMKDHQAGLRRELAAIAPKLQRVTADEAALAADLANEQARWTDLNQRMEALEAALGPK
jgi:chromosome segregation ATPase